MTLQRLANEALRVTCPELRFAEGEGCCAHAATSEVEGASIAAAAHASALARKNPMNSQWDRLGWVEVDVRKSIARLNEMEGLLRSAESQASAQAKELRRETRDTCEEMGRATRAEVGELRRDTVQGVTILSGRINVHTLALLALAAVTLIEAIAIVLLWWLR